MLALSKNRGCAKSRFTYERDVLELVTMWKSEVWEVTFNLGAFHLVCTHFYMLSGPTLPLLACNTQWKCIGGLTPPP